MRAIKLSHGAEAVDRAEVKVDRNSRAVDIDELVRAMHETERDSLNVPRSTAFTGLEQQGIDSPVDHQSERTVANARYRYTDTVHILPTPT